MYIARMPSAPVSDYSSYEELAQGAALHNKQAAKKQAAKWKGGRCACCIIITIVVVVLNVVIPCMKVFKRRHHFVGPARTYYLEQRPRILAAARSMHLNWYWVQASPDIAKLEVNAGPLSGGQGSYSVTGSSSTLRPTPTGTWSTRQARTIGTATWRPHDSARCAATSRCMAATTSRSRSPSA